MTASLLVTFDVFPAPIRPNTLSRYSNATKLLSEMFCSTMFYSNYISYKSEYVFH